MLQDQIAVVTGTVRGIGRAIAIEMAANGADVVVIDIAGKVQPKSTRPDRQGVSLHRG
jgi:NAD(P)-dependent dehydrogenase (short-subunit alcohol dehydrogenase family)